MLFFFVDAVSSIDAYAYAVLLFRAKPDECDWETIPYVFCTKKDKLGAFADQLSSRTLSSRAFASE